MVSAALTSVIMWIKSAISNKMLTDTPCYNKILWTQVEAVFVNFSFRTQISHKTTESKWEQLYWRINYCSAGVKASILWEVGKQGIENTWEMKKLFMEKLFPCSDTRAMYKDKHVWQRVRVRVARFIEIKIYIICSWVKLGARRKSLRERVREGVAWWRLTVHSC